MEKVILVNYTIDCKEIIEEFDKGFFYNNVLNQKI